VHRHSVELQHTFCAKRDTCDTDAESCNLATLRCVFPDDAIALFYASPYGETRRAISPRCVSYDEVYGSFG